jgi:hypothetical protein
MSPIGTLRLAGLGWATALSGQSTSHWVSYNGVVR